MKQFPFSEDELTEFGFADGMRLPRKTAEPAPEAISDDFDLAELDALLSDYDARMAGEDLPAAEAQSPVPLEELPEEEPAQEQTEEAPPIQRKNRHPLPELKHDPDLSRSHPGRKKGLIIALAVAAAVLLALSVVLFLAASEPYNNRILPGTTVGGIPVGGMTKGEAKKAIQAATADTFPRQGMEISLLGQVLTLTPEETGAKLDIRSAAKAAYRLGRKGTEQEILAAVEASQGSGTNLDLLPHLALDQQLIRDRISRFALENNIAHTEATYRLEGTRPQLSEDGFDENAPGQTLAVTLGTPRQEVDVDAVLKAVLDAYSQNTFRVDVPQEYLSQPALPDLEAIAREFYIPGINAGLDLQTYEKIPGSYGYAVDVQAGQELLAQADYGETVQIGMVYEEPEILGDGVYFRDELGYCQTPHTNNDNRNTNLKLACAALDGLVLQPGEEFSYNGTLGERTKEKGYKPAAAYSGTKTVDSIGGGICQVSSTLYYATLIADMEIVYRINHGFKSTYIGVGLDATVNWGGPDFQFANNSNFPVMIKAEVSDGYVKIRIMGTEEKDYYVKMTSGYSEDEKYIYAWSYKHKYDRETDKLISKEKEAYSCYMK